MREQLSGYKFRKIATESFRNGLRLHFDSIILYNIKSFPSSLLLSIIAMEEISKSNWVEHYYWSSTVNGGFPEAKFEQEWLKLLYSHPIKQKAFFEGFYFDLSPKFIKSIEKNELEILKQKVTYVGLHKAKNKIDVNSRISIPQKINYSVPKKIISLLNDYLIDVCKKKDYQEYYFDIEEKDHLITARLYNRLKMWKHKSGLRSDKYYREWMQLLKKPKTI